MEETLQQKNPIARGLRGRFAGLGRKAAVGAGALALAAGVVVPTGLTAPAASAAGSSITICEIAALSGPFLELGQYGSYGAQAWANYVNHNGGLDGHQVKLVKEDDRSDPATASSLARKCVVQDHATFIFGPEETSTAASAIPVINSLKVVDVVWESGWQGQGVTGSNLTGYAFPSITNVFHADDLAFAQKYIQPHHLKRVAVIEDNAPGGLGNDTYTAQIGKKFGFKMVASQKVNPGSTNDTPQIVKLLAAKPQAIILGMIPGTDTITALKAIRAQNPNIPIGECSGCTLPSFIKAAGGYATMKNVYMIGTPAQVAANIPKNGMNKPAISDTQLYLKAMKADHLTTQNDLDQSSSGWDAARELQEAVAKSHSIDEDTVRTAMSHQVVTVGGLFAQFFHRTPKNYENITHLESAMSILKANGQLTVVSAG